MMNSLKLWMNGNLPQCFAVTFHCLCVPSNSTCLVAYKVATSQSFLYAVRLDPALSESNPG